MTGLYALEVGSALSYVTAVLVPALDALVPVLPSETVVIALGVATVGSADPRIGLLVALAALGAFLGDNAAYLAGRRFGPAVDRRLSAGERGARRRAWAQQSLDRFGTRIIIACRFIPGGRTAVTLSGGLIGYPRRRFAAATAFRDTRRAAPHNLYAHTSRLLEQAQAASKARDIGFRFDQGDLRYGGHG